MFKKLKATLVSTVGSHSTMSRSCVTSLGVELHLVSKATDTDTV